MQFSNELILRPRFRLEREESCNQILGLFAEAKKAQKNFIVSSVDRHVFIKLPKSQQHFWSPQLHLELSETTENRSILKGFFGPNPTAWTLFMFLHVVLAILFIANAIWLYTNYKLNNTILLQLTISIGIVLIWVLLYVAGSMGKKKGKTHMHELYNFMLKTINSSSLS